MEVGYGASVALWRAVDRALGAGGELVAQRLAWTAPGVPGPLRDTCSVQAGPVNCGREAPWVITIPGMRGRVAVPTCEGCRPLAWALAARGNHGQVGQLPARAAGWEWPAGRCSGCGQVTRSDAAPPACGVCAAAGCNIETGRRGCRAAGPPPAAPARRRRRHGPLPGGRRAGGGGGG